MCGIAGWFRYGNIKPTETELTSLFTSLQTRGTDAAGIAWIKDGSIRLLKAPVRASEFVELPDFKKVTPDILDADWVLLHCRQATNGSPRMNENNHPIFNKKGMIIHNGVVTVDKALRAGGETDSEQIMLYVQKYGWEEGLSKVSGFLAIAYVDFMVPGFYLYAHNAPIDWTYDFRREMFIFCSTKHIMEKGFGRLETKGTPDDTVYHVGYNHQITEIGKFKTKPFTCTYWKGGKYYARTTPDHSGYPYDFC